MDQFSFFFGFYALFLGLAVTELLASFAGMVRERMERQIDIRLALLGIYIFMAICATWIDAWSSLKDVTLDFQGLWRPILIATSYYLAGTVALPRDAADYPRTAEYYEQRKYFIVGMLLTADLLVNSTLIPLFIEDYQYDPKMFWLDDLPLNVILFGCYAGILLSRRKWVNIALILLLIALILHGYWGETSSPFMGLAPLLGLT